jgi:hypothetical protein
MAETFLLKYFTETIYENERLPVRKTAIQALGVLLCLGCSENHTADLGGPDSDSTSGLDTDSEAHGTKDSASADGNADTDTNADVGTDSDADSDIDSDSDSDSDTADAMDTGSETEPEPVCVGSLECYSGAYDYCCGCRTEYRCEKGQCVSDEEWCYDSFCCDTVLPCTWGCGVENPDEDYNGTCGDKDCNAFLESMGYYDPTYLGCCPDGPDVAKCGMDITAMEWTDPGVCVPVEDPDADAGVPKT